MHRGLPCSDATTDTGPKTPTSGPEPTDDNSSPKTCSPTSTSSKVETTRVYSKFQHDAVINMILDNDMPWLMT
jgi:hypothetical protein